MRHSEGWRLRTEHETTYRYDAPARASYNEVRQIPLTTSFQTTLEARVLTMPQAPQFSYWDYWGTQVVAFNVDAPHDHLVVRGSSLVETQPAAAAPEATWADLAEAADRNVELVRPSSFTRPTDELAEVAAGLRQSSAVDTVRAVAHFASESLRYVRGVTDVYTSAAQAFETGSGVCQDFAHLALTLLRSVGIPARYVSGYLHPDADAAVGVAASAESHAWIEAWVGRWWALDPTNDVEAGVRHIVVARGRDYGDVPPVKGVYAGSGGRQSDVAVTITRVA
jgi:transglutaminase-like putative cysteine protease